MIGVSQQQKIIEKMEDTLHLLEIIDRELYVSANLYIYLRKHFGV